MPVYTASPFKPPVQLAVAGTPAYLIGSYNNNTGPTFGYVQSNSAVTTTATLVFQITQGNVPAVGSLITVVGCANSANFNVTNVAIASVSTTNAGICTVTYTITSTTQSNTSDGGQVLIPQPEVGETVSAAYKSAPIARPFNNPNIQEGQSLTFTLNLGAGLSAVTATLEAADLDLDSEYSTVHTFANAGLSSFQTGQDANGAVGGVNQLNFRFYRFNISILTGSGKVIGKAEI
jgi:hypothetical protein